MQCYADQTTGSTSYYMVPNTKYDRYFPSLCFPIYLINHYSYGCSFVAKLIRKKKIKKENICFLQNMYYLQKRKCFYTKQKFYSGWWE